MNKKKYSYIYIASVTVLTSFVVASSIIFFGIIRSYSSIKNHSKLLEQKVDSIEKILSKVRVESLKFDSSITTYLQLSDSPKVFDNEDDEFSTLPKSPEKEVTSNLSPSLGNRSTIQTDNDILSKHYNEFQHLDTSKDNFFWSIFIREIEQKYNLIKIPSFSFMNQYPISILSSSIYRKNRKYNFISLINEIVGGGNLYNFLENVTFSTTDSNAHFELANELTTAKDSALEKIPYDKFTFNRLFAILFDIKDHKSNNKNNQKGEITYSFTRPLNHQKFDRFLCTKSDGFLLTRGNFLQIGDSLQPMELFNCVENKDRSKLILFTVQNFNKSKIDSLASSGDLFILKNETDLKQLVLFQMNNH